MRNDITMEEIIQRLEGFELDHYVDAGCVHLYDHVDDIDPMIVFLLKQMGFIVAGR